MEAARFTMVARPEGTLLLWRSELRSGAGELRFGSQEEMGLGVRVASPLRVKGGSGSIRNSAGGIDEAGTWGKEAGWWDYSGTAGDRRAGVLVVVLPEASRKCWGHTRDYGLLVANPTPPPDSKEKGFVVPAGESFKLGFAVLLHETGAAAARDPGSAFDPAAAAAECLEASRAKDEAPRR